MRRAVQLIVLVALSVVAVPATAAAHNANFPARIDLPNGFRPEGIESGRGTTFYVGSLADGTILKGDLRGDDRLHPVESRLVEGAPGRAAVGIAYEERLNRLWVAGGGPAVRGIGDVRVYDASTGAELAVYGSWPDAFLNDVAITRDAVYVTDSRNARLIVIPLGRHGSLPPASEAVTLPVTGYVHMAGTNLNGIVAKAGALLVAQTNTGKLFRVDPNSGAAQEIDLGGVALTNADGLELVGHTLYVVRNFSNLVSVVRLGRQLTYGTVLGDITSPGLDIPSTVTVAAGRLWAVNTRFSTTPTPTTPYWITQLPLRP
jgi:hypothetical protein